MNERTKAQQYVVDQLTPMLAPVMPYRVGALVLTYDDPDGDPLSCRTAIGMAMQEPITDATAVHLTNILKALRQLADEMEAKIKGPRP